ncbi:hypothetical protein BKA70DRAFT_1222585 [Coprinopsis sp. MPI-PUGE-AT-0042]|nr:hypothetical protein BKA70DRAFT_1222585 [Coprinopsis sp. MPI-PUGE-AT-0042]
MPSASLMHDSVQEPSATCGGWQFQTQLFERGPNKITARAEHGGNVGATGDFGHAFSPFQCDGTIVITTLGGALRGGLQGARESLLGGLPNKALLIFPTEPVARRPATVRTKCRQGQKDVRIWWPHHKVTSREMTTHSQSKLALVHPPSVRKMSSPGLQSRPSKREKAKQWIAHRMDGIRSGLTSPSASQPSTSAQAGWPQGDMLAGSLETDSIPYHDRTSSSANQPKDDVSYPAQDLQDQGILTIIQCGKHVRETIIVKTT